MARVGYKDCVARAFSPLVEAARREELAGHLTTQRLSVEDSEVQFPKFGSLRTTDAEPLFLPNGGFLYPFLTNDSLAIAISLYEDIEELENSLRPFLEENQGYIEEMDASSFLFLSYHAHDYMRLRQAFQKQLAAENVINVIDDNYKGHDIYDLMSYYQPVYVIYIPTESAITMANQYSIAVEVINLLPSLRPAIIDQQFSDSAYKLISYPCIDSEKIFLSLVSTRWRYVFLELYRCLEALLYVPWMTAIQRTIPTSMPLRDLYSSIRNSLNWREHKSSSFEMIFDLFKDRTDLDAHERNIEIFFDLTNSEGFQRRQIGKRINKIRNQLVHHEDSDDRSILDVSESQFRLISLYLAIFIGEFCEEYDSKLRTTSP